MDEDQRVWAAMIFPTGVTEVFGALRGSVRRYWMRLDAQQEVEHWITEMKLGPLRWQTIDDQIAIGCCDAHVFVVRSILLPRGDPPGLARISRARPVPSRAGRFPPIRRVFGCCGIPLIFDCSGRFNSLIGRKIRLIRQVTNFQSKPLKCSPILVGCRAVRRRNTRFSLYLDARDRWTGAKCALAPTRRSELMSALR
jgi:hypothetical protein